MLSRHDALEKFNSFNPALYAKTRNFLNGQISRLSAHIKYGIITNKELYRYIRDKYNFVESEKFIQELAWRDFWRSYAYHHPDQLWTDVEEYKTGFRSEEYQDNLPEDIMSATHQHRLLIFSSSNSLALGTFITMHVCIWLLILFTLEE